MSLTNVQIKTNYFSNQVSSDYKCSFCHHQGCKLWREYQRYLEYQSLYCVDCALKNQKMEGTFVREDGKYLYDKGKATDLKTGQLVDYERWTDQLEWLVPAVPLEDEDTFWGYTSVPANGADWWKKLPLRNLS
ncbi:MAG: hypothetical protein WAQ98_18540 [Blastocatellia bacterium]